MEVLEDVLESIPWYAWVAIIAIIGGTVTSVTKMILHHQERMEMIQRGMDPEAGPKDQN